MKLEDKYRLLKMQGIVTLLGLMGFTLWNAFFQENVWPYFIIIGIIGIVQLYIFIKYWQPTLKEYLKQQKENKTE